MQNQLEIQSEQVHDLLGDLSIPARDKKERVTQLLRFIEAASVLRPQFKTEPREAWEVKLVLMVVYDFKLISTMIRSRSSFKLELDCIVKIITDTLTVFCNSDLKTFKIEESVSEHIIQELHDILEYIKVEASKVEWLGDWLAEWQSKNTTVEP